MPNVPAQSDPNNPRPGHGLLGWLGRQVGYVSKAIKTNVEDLPKVVYRNGTVKEAPHPSDPRVKLRRTVIDEVVVENGKAKQNP